VNLVQELRQLLASDDRVTANETVREQHSRDVSSYHLPKLPDAVVYPVTTQEVCAVVRYAAQQQIPIVPFGVGSSVEGQVVPVHGGLSLDFSLMNKVLEVRPQDFLVRVQPGVTRMQLNQELKRHGLFFPVDPGADATLGGMAATNASGTTAVRYGTMRHQVLGLEVVLADGQLVRTGGMAVKSSAGYNLTGLLVGSEGTLGVFTELLLRVYGIPECTFSARAVFADVETAAQAATDLMTLGLPLDRVELVDEHTVRAVNQFKGTTLTEAPTLFVELSGSKNAVDTVAAEAVDLLRETCSEVEFVQDGTERAKLWAARHEAAFAFAASAPGKRLMTTDVCVPLSVLPAAIARARQTMNEHGLQGALLGHVGDGNYHAVFVVDPHSEESLQSAAVVNEEIVRYALEQGGTCTGEHGVGLGKAQFLPVEHGAGVALMKTIKDALDPHHILNPGKLFLTDTQQR